jgi:hypothetical protein
MILFAAGCQPSSTPPTKTVAAPPKKQSPTRETWDVCYLQGMRVGLVETTVYRETLDGQPVDRTECRNEIEVKRYGQASKMKIRYTSFERPDGELVRFESVLEMGPQPKRTVGRVVGKRLELVSEDRSRKTSSSLSWSPDYGGFNAMEQSLLRKPMEPGERRTFESLLPGFVQLATLNLLAREREEVNLPGGSQELLRIDAVSILPDAQKIQQTLWTDRRGELLKTYSKEMNMATLRTTKADALKPNAGELFDINIQTAVKLDRAIPRAHETKTIRYRLHLDGDDPAKVFPAGPTQQIRSIDANTAELTAFSIRAGQKDGNADPPADPPSEADRQPNSMIQSDDPLVISLADQAAEQETDPRKTVLKLEKFVHEYISQKDFSQVFASAAEAAKTKEGDCTEHAVLLAALCRAKKIPARVAIGLVYTDRRTPEGMSPEFGYHMWVEAYLDGRWIPLDATLGRGGIGAAHLKVAHSNLHGNSMYSSFLPVVQVVGRLKVEVLEVR